MSKLRPLCLNAHWKKKLAAIGRYLLIDRRTTGEIGNRPGVRSIDNRVSLIRINFASHHQAGPRRDWGQGRSDWRRLCVSRWGEAQTPAANSSRLLRRAKSAPRESRSGDAEPTRGATIVAIMRVTHCQ